MTQLLGELVTEAGKEMAFASKQLLGELESFGSEEAFDQRIAPLVKAFADEHGISIDAIWSSVSGYVSDVGGDSGVGASVVLEPVRRRLREMPIPMKQAPLLEKLQEMPAFVEQESEASRALKHGLDMETRMRSAIKWLRKDLVDKLDRIDKKLDERISRTTDAKDKRNLEYLRLAYQTKLVYQYTDIWSIYRVAWEQHRDRKEPLYDLLAVADRTVNELYSIIHEHEKGLKLHVDKQALITVFFRSEGYTHPSRTLLMPYVVIPRWASRHIWIGSAAAHEVGHNVLWNVQGLFDELLVKLMLTLAARRVSYERQKVWGQWMGEIFADLFGLLQIGPAIIRSLQRIFVHVPPHLLRKLSSDLPDAAIDEPRVADNFIEEVRADLWVADDAEHPVEYLRVWLSIEAYKLLAGEHEWKSIEDDLKTRWESFLKKEDAKEVRGKFTLLRGSPPLAREIRGNSARVMLEEEGKTVLQVMLFTPLHTLAGKDGKPRSMVDVFHHKCQYEEIKKATKELLNPIFPPASFKDIRTVLAAAEYAFEQEKEEGLSELSERLVKAIQSI